MKGLQMGEPASYEFVVLLVSTKNALIPHQLPNGPYVFLPEFPQIIIQYSLRPFRA